MVLQHLVDLTVGTQVETNQVHLGRLEIHETLLQILRQEVLNRSKEVQHAEHDHLHINQHALYPLIMDHRTAIRLNLPVGGVICEESHLGRLLQKKLYANK